VRPERRAENVCKNVLTLSKVNLMVEKKKRKKEVQKEI
jgi:hypothetical protein